MASYLPYHSSNICLLKSSPAAGKKEIKESRIGTTFVMAATASQLQTFLEAMGELQAEGAVKGWILVLDESDALQT